MAAADLPMEISCQEVAKLLEQPAAIRLLDCRERNEYELVSIPGAQLVPMSEISDRLAELEPYKGDRLVIHCHHGGRSMRVVNWLRQQGFLRTQSMAGGIDVWAQVIDPSLIRY